MPWRGQDSNGIENRWNRRAIETLSLLQKLRMITGGARLFRRNRQLRYSTWVISVQTVDNCSLRCELLVRQSSFLPNQGKPQSCIGWVRQSIQLFNHDDR